MWTQKLFFHKSGTTFSKQFSLKKNFFSSILGCLKTCVIYVTKCVAAKIYRLKIKFYKLYFSKVFYRQFMPFLHIKLRTYYQTSFYYFFFFYYSKLQNVFKHVLIASQIAQCKKLVGNHFYMEKLTLIYPLNMGYILRGCVNEHYLSSSDKFIGIYSYHTLDIEINVGMNKK